MFRIDLPKMKYLRKSLNVKGNCFAIKSFLHGERNSLKNAVSKMILINHTVPLLIKYIPPV